MTEGGAAAAAGAAPALYANHKVDRAGVKLEGFLEKTAKYTKAWTKRFVSFEPATRELGYGESPVKMKATVKVTSVIRASEEDSAIDGTSPALLSFVVSSADDGGHSFGVRCPDRATFHAWFFAIRHSLGKAGLMPDFDAGLPGRDPRTGLRFARVPPEHLFRFGLMDRAVLTLFTTVTLPSDDWLASNSATMPPSGTTTTTTTQLSAGDTTKAPAADTSASPADAAPAVPAASPPKRRTRTKTFYQRFISGGDKNNGTADESLPTEALPEPSASGDNQQPSPAAMPPMGEQVLLLVINRHLYLFRPSTQIVRCVEIEFIGAIFTGSRCLGIASRSPERDLFVSDCDNVPKVVEVLRAVSAFAREDKSDKLRVRMTQAAPSAVVRELDFQTLSESVAAAAAKPVPPTPKAALKAAMDKAIAGSSSDDEAAALSCATPKPALATNTKTAAAAPVAVPPVAAAATAATAEPVATAAAAAKPPTTTDKKPAAAGPLRPDPHLDEFL